MKKIPVIIDTDLTCDDAVALAMAARYEKLDIKAIAVSGGAECNTASALAKQLGINCTVAKGQPKLMFGQCFDTLDMYGTEKDYKPFLTCCEDKTEFADSVETIYAEAVKADGQLEIFAMGPLTDIALAILRYPQLKKLIKRIVAMVGTGYVGNAAPYSEYNAWLDPYAAKVVFDSGIPVVICGLDAVEQSALTVEDISKLSPQNPFTAHILNLYTDSGKLNTDSTASIPAAVAMAYFIDESVGTAQDFYVAVETKSSSNRGWTIVDRLGKYKKQPNIKVVTLTDKQKFAQQLQNI
ncbi:MAG: nucleoside hydrolase [Oscillospiraceae bacterium]|nr:nucleoside hydrolase [Oscillospiraceae bacterium]